MANTTPNYNLTKPLVNENYDVSVPNANMDKVDTAMKGLEDSKIAKSLATAENDFLVASGAGAWIKKTLAEVKTILGLGSAAYTESSAYAAATHGHAQSDITGLTTALANLQSLIFKSKTVTVAAWNVDAEFTGWGYRAAIVCSGALATMVPSVSFAPADIATRNFASFSVSYDGGVYIYARAVPAASVTIPNLVFIKGAV